MYLFSYGFMLNYASKVLKLLNADNRAYVEMLLVVVVVMADSL